MVGDSAVICFCRLELLPSTMESCQEFLEHLAELEEAASFQEFLDIADLLAPVLQAYGDADSLLQALAA